MARTSTPIDVRLIRTIAVPVADQDRALSFYVDTLGFEKRMDASYGGVDTGIRMESSDATAAYQALKDKWARIEGELLKVPVPMFVFRDPDGNRLVLVQGQPAA